jgi:Flp pilus assembly pilin Flp
MRGTDIEQIAADLYSIAVSEHGHDETHRADWPSCLPVHMAMNRYRDALTSPEPWLHPRLGVAALRESLSPEEMKAMKGQGLAEYGLLLALIAVIAIAALALLGTQISDFINALGQSI